MSFDIIAEPTVKSPKDKRPRRGRGFSIEEVKQADLTTKEARDMGLIVDKRRTTVHPENIDALKQYIKDIEDMVDALTTEVKKEPTKVSTESVKELSSLKAVKKSEAELLVKAGIKTLEDLAYCEIPKISKKTGIGEERITAMVTAALKKV